ncbi:ribosomal protein S18 acetylase RimI-like enzyme [Kitasatospora sp. MAA4]|uniref:GNAT family N-acetyltransferase n=1 Tax=Kitasatospora sp. MAA4 TaxID=3035093 RepID=UPI0024769697|nr:GNAT family N-acetyltransferase [Kitasatospora sp. MAA4]MDH6130651.1 ribosomal protein S18 acetylase RimI-like enzyme [Kitasatospora sp. MAA4]
MSDLSASFAEYQPDLPAGRTLLDAVLSEAAREDLGVLAALQVRVRGGSERELVDRLARALDDERRAVVVARVGGVVAGYANVAFLPQHPVDGAPGGYYLTGVTVDHPWRRRGLGRLLTRWRMAWVWERDTDVRCFVSSANRASIDLHLALGFTVVRTGRSFQGITFAAGEGVLMSARRSAAPPA